MSQTVILKKFIAFSKIKYAEYNDELEKEKTNTKDPTALKKINDRQAELKKNHENLINNFKDNGYCFGFALVHAMMRLDGKLLWWESLLQKITLWDENKDTLKAEINLPNKKPIKAKKRKHQKKDFIKKQKTFEQLITRAMDYIVASQCNDPPFVHTDNQKFILKPDAFEDSVPNKTPGKKKSYFECHLKESIQSIQQYKEIAGNFSKTLLKNILDEKKLADCIILVHNGDHTISLAWTGSDWMLYDANDDHSDLQKIHFIGNKEDCIDKIFNILGTSLHFEFASFDPNKKFDFPAYEEIKRRDPASLLSKHGICLWARLFPDELLACLNKASTSPKLKNRIIKKCHRSFASRFYNADCGLNFLMGKNKKILPLILKLGQESRYYESMHKNIMKALAKINSKGNPTLIKLINHAPENIVSLLEFLVKDQDSLFATMNLFLEKNKENESVWSILKKNAPAQMKNVVNFFIKKLTDIDHDFYAAIPSPEKLSFPQLILKALVLKTSFQNTPSSYDKDVSSLVKFAFADHAFSVIFIKNSGFLPSIVKLALSAQDGLDELMTAFNLQNASKTKTNWQRLIKCTEKTEIMELITEHIQKMDTATLEKYKKKCQTSFYNIPVTCPQKIFDNKTVTGSFNSFVLKEIDAQLLKLQVNTCTPAVGICLTN